MPYAAMVIEDVELSTEETYLEEDDEEVQPTDHSKFFIIQLDQLKLLLQNAMIAGLIEFRHLIFQSKLPT
uniref:Uncharacterized protein n=1 Tax=Ditylenchus dipsaci TaxID=166011 RepID=A0A915DAK9_9BILA